MPPQTELKQGMGRWRPASSHDALFSDRGPHPEALVFGPLLLKPFSIFPLEGELCKVSNRTFSISESSAVLLVDNWYVNES